MRRHATEYTANNDGSDSESNASSNVSVEGKVNEQGERESANKSICAAADHESCESARQKSKSTVDENLTVDSLCCNSEHGTSMNAESAIENANGAVKAKTRNIRFTAKDKKKARSEPVNNTEGFHIKCKSRCNELFESS